ncbi:MAG: MotA/TolQ/ExbB proton channel family protein [Gammaproteobacteria bacterium]|nr:MotA/TolQ/ExbB proton channel family protein [Gammaproteobacteria bacterium]
MFELIQAGGLLMWPILICSVVALAIIGERLWSLQVQRIAPQDLLPQIWTWIRNNELNNARLQDLQLSSPLGKIMASGLTNRSHSREIMKEAIEDSGRHVIHELERYLNTLGTIAATTPLLGLLGTVIGMIKVFSAITTQGVGDAAPLAGGISEALLTTAAGLVVAIPSLMFYRYFRGRVEMLVMLMEEEAMKMLEIMHGERESEDNALDIKK